MLVEFGGTRPQARYRLKPGSRRPCECGSRQPHASAQIWVLQSREVDWSKRRVKLSLRSAQIRKCSSDHASGRSTCGVLPLK